MMSLLLLLLVLLLVLLLLLLFLLLLLVLQQLSGSRQDIRRRLPKPSDWLLVAASFASASQHAEASPGLCEDLDPHAARHASW